MKLSTFSLIMTSVLSLSLTTNIAYAQQFAAATQIDKKGAEITKTYKRQPLQDLDYHSLAFKEQSRALNHLAKDGTAGTGGGVLNTERMRTFPERLAALTQKVVDNDGSWVRSELVAFLVEIKKYPAQGKMHSKLLQLIDKGLIDDVKRSKYVPSSLCLEDVVEDGVAVQRERDASTPRGVPYADICVNLNRMAAETASESQLLTAIVPLLMHESVRHLGEEDRIPTGVADFDIQPISMFVADHYDYLQTALAAKELLQSGSAEALREQLEQQVREMATSTENNSLKRFYNHLYKPRFYSQSTQSIIDAVYVPSLNAYTGKLVYDIYTTDPSTIKVMIENVSGNCGKNPLKLDNDRNEYPIRAGEYLPSKTAGNFVLKQKEGMFFNHGEVGQDCEIQLSVQNKFGKMVLQDTLGYGRSSILEYNINFVDLKDSVPKTHVP